MKRLAGVLAVVFAITAETAVADAAVLKVSPHRLTFGKQAFDSFTTKTITMTNVGSTALLVAIEQVDVPDDFSPGQPGYTCPLYAPTLLEAGKSCTQIVGFSPSRSFAGRQSATLRITARNPESGIVQATRVVKISGTGVEAASRTLLEIVPNQIDFGTRPVGSENFAAVTVTNRSASDLRVLASAGLPDDFGFGLLPGSTCPVFDPGGIVAPRASCDAVVRFSPTELFAGLRQVSELIVTARDPATGTLLETHHVAVIGQGSP
jgi:hypothetical protein